MIRDPKTIVGELKGLIGELELVLSGQKLEKGSPKSKRETFTSPDILKGALGAVLMLINEGFLDKPKKLSEIMEKLKEIGHYHKQAAVAMNLLNLTKRRQLNRFKNKETKNWEYVIRK